MRHDEEDDADSRPWPTEPVQLSPDWEQDDDSGEPPVIDDDPEHPQFVDAFASREQAEARAAAVNASHGNKPFIAFIRDEAGDGTNQLVTADALPTRSGRWAVLLVIEAEAL